MPALAKMPYGAPNCSSRSANDRVTCASSVTSQASPMAPPAPSARAISAASFALPPFLSRMATRSPRRAQSTAAARPIPPPPPVMTMSRLVAGTTRDPSAARSLGRLREVSHAVDLHLHAQGHHTRTYRSTRRLESTKDFRVYLVHEVELFHVVQVDGALDHILQIGADAAKDGLQVQKNQPR